VTGTFFLDSSALIKLYHQEPGTERVEEIFAAPDTSLRRRDHRGWGLPEHQQWRQLERSQHRH